MRLENLGKSTLLRLNATTRDYEGMQPLQMKQFQKTFGLLCNDPEGEASDLRFRLPSLQELLKFKVVVSTCVSGGIPSALGVPAGHFDWIFVDEAGQASEPEGQ